MGRLNAGDLTERISLTNPTAAVSDGRGGQLPGAPATPVEAYAQKRELSGAEVLRLGQTLGASIVEFTIRYREDVSTTTLVTWQGRSYGIRQVVHDSRKEFSALTCVDNGRA